MPFIVSERLKVVLFYSYSVLLNCFSIFAMNTFALFSSLNCYKTFVLDCFNHFSSYEPILIFKDSFSVDKSTMSSPTKSKASLIAEIIETSCSPFLTSVAKHCDLKLFHTVLVRSILSSEIICIASSIYWL